MKKLFIPTLIAVFALVLTPVGTFAAKPTGGISSGGTTTTTELVGYDVSYPQCGTTLPTGQYFGIVGLNNGVANTTNTCAAAQLAWASQSLSGSHQPKVQVYVNTANPGQVAPQVQDWPTATPTGVTDPYGACAGANDLACSWQYGWNRADDDVLQRFAPAAQTAGIATTAGSYTWWLDVETGNSWQSGSTDAYSRNVAALEGMTARFENDGAKVGLYSTASQWTTITNNQIGGTSNLNGLANWRPSGSRLSTAISNCSVAPLTAGGYISLTQYVVQRSIDKNHSCI